MKKWKKISFIYGFISWPFIIFFLVCLFNGSILSIKGFGLDSNQNLYVAKEGKIIVYNNDDVDVNTKDIDVFDGDYNFTVLHNDTLLLAYSNIVYTMDVSGNIISQKEDEHQNTYNQLKDSKNEYIDIYGNKYLYVNNWGYYSIERLDKDKHETIYKMPVSDYISLIINIVYFVSFVIMIPVILYIWWKEEGSKIKMGWFSRFKSI